MPSRRRWRLRFALVRCAVMACVAIGAAPPVRAAEVILWPTYLRAAPGRSAVVIGELSRDESVVLRDCTGDWCRIEVDGALGYVERSRVGAIGPTPPTGAAADRADCFASQRAGYKGGQRLRLCPRPVAAAPTAAGASSTATAGR